MTVRLHAPNIFLSGGCSGRISRVAAPAFKGGAGKLELYMLERIIAFSSVASVVLVAALLQLTSPANVGPFGVFVLFVLIYLSVFGVLTFFIFWMSQIASRIVLLTRARRAIQPLGFRRAYYFASVSALAPVMVVGMQSVGEVGIYETFLVIFFTVIACVYIAKRTS